MFTKGKRGKLHGYIVLERKASPPNTASRVFLVNVDNLLNMRESDRCPALSSDKQRVLLSAFVSAEALVRATRKLFIFIRKNRILSIKVANKYLIYFRKPQKHWSCWKQEKNDAAACYAQSFCFQPKHQLALSKNNCFQDKPILIGSKCPRNI